LTVFSDVIITNPSAVVKKFVFGFNRAWVIDAGDRSWRKRKGFM